MKKIFMALVTLLTVSSVSAEVCTAKLEQHDRYSSYTIQRFVKFDYDQQWACEDAMYDCRQEMRERRRWDRFANLTCSLEGRNPGQGRQQCSFDLQRRNGRIIDTFSRQSCRAAEDACMRDLVRRNRNGNALRARCVRGYSSPTNPGRQQVTRSCTVDKRGGQGRVRDSFTAQATGRQGSGVKAQACSKAMRKCQNTVVRNQYCTRR